MESLSTAEHIEHLADEYRSLVDRVDHATDETKLRTVLVRDAEWTAEGARTVVMLAKRYGAFVLANALALAEALDIEDGDAGI